MENQLQISFSKAAADMEKTFLWLCLSAERTVWPLPYKAAFSPWQNMASSAIIIILQTIPSNF